MILFLAGCFADYEPNPFADKCDWVPTASDTGPGPCVDPEGGGSGGGGGGSSGLTVTQVPIAASCDAPEGRTDALAASFVLESPMVAGARTVARGFVVLGGEDDAGGLLSDLWVFDTGALTTGGCPWIELDASTAIGGISGGSMVFDEVDASFAVVGGWREVGGSTRVASKARYRIDATTGTITSAGEIPSVAYTQVVLGDNTYTPFDSADANGDSCGATGLRVCGAEGWETTLGTCLLSAGDAVALAACCDAMWASVTRNQVDPCADGTLCSSGGDVTHPGCVEDPNCTDGESQVDGATASHAELAQLAGVWDPIAAQAWWFGGTTGCEGDCGTFEDVFALDGTGTESATAANVDPVFHGDAGSMVSDGTIQSVHYPTDYPDGGFIGRRGAAAVVTGAHWDIEARAWEGSTSVALVGGTTHQAIGPGVQNVLDCASYLCNVCQEWVADWQPVAPPASGPHPGIVSGDAAVVVFDGSGWTTTSIDIGERMRLAAAPFDDDRALFIGGETSLGASEGVYLVDMATGAVDDYLSTTDMGGREGAVAVFDRLDRAAYIFGGAGSDNAVYVATDGTQLVDGANMTLSLVEEDGTTDAAAVEIAIGWDGSTWAAGATESWAVSCTTDCFADRLAVTVPTRDDYATLTMEISWADDPGTVWTLTAESATVDSPESGQTTVSFPLPRILTNGDRVKLHGGWVPHNVSRPAIAGCVAQAPHAGCQFPVGGDSARVFHGIPFLPTLALNSVAIETTFTVPEGSTPVAPGERVDASTFGRFEGRELGSAAVLGPEFLVFDELDWQRHVPGSGTLGLDVWADPGLVLSGDTAAYLAATTGEVSMLGDLAWLETRYGPVRNGGWHMIWLRADAGIIAASTTAGITLQFVGNPGGTMRAEKDWRYNTIHELGHEWFAAWNGEGKRVEAAARWLHEGLATLTGLMRVPSALYYSKLQGNTFRADPLPAMELAYQTANYADLFWCQGIRNDLDSDATEAFVQYEIGAYTWMQIYATWRADGGTDADFWTQVQAIAATEPTDAAEVEAAVNLLVGPTFYTEWVKTGRKGLPLLALDAWGPADGVYDPTGPTPFTVRVSQVQQAMYTTTNGCPDNAAVSTSVPYMLACGTEVDPSLAPFTECHTSVTSVLSELPSILAAEFEDITLTPSTGLGTLDPYPAKVALLANDALLPDNLLTAGMESTYAYGRQWRWFLVCEDADTTSCGADADADTFPAETDCDDGANTTFPGASPPGPGPYSDNNCDGWQ